MAGCRGPAKEATAIGVYVGHRVRVVLTTPPEPVVTRGMCQVNVRRSRLRA